MLASRTMFPTCRTMPPRISSSTRLDSSTSSPVWRSTSSPILLDHRRVELDGAGDGDVDAAVLVLPELVELAADAEDLRHPVLLDQQLEEVDELRLGAGDRPLQPLHLLGRGEVGAEEEDLQLAVAVDRVGELAELLCSESSLPLSLPASKRASAYTRAASGI